MSKKLETVPGGKTLLLVEDESLLATMETRWLNKAGYKVIHANSGEKAVEIVKSKAAPIDLILMDINLGSGIDGTEAAKEILSENDIPLLFLSSHTEKEVVEKTEQITSYGYVVKDSKDVVLLASIKMAFKLFNANKALKIKDEALMTSEARLRRAEFISQAGSWELHLKSGTIIASEGALKVYGFENNVTSYEEIKKITLNEYRAEIDEAFKNLIERGVPFNVKFKIKKVDTGEIIDIHSTAEYDKEEQIVFGVLKDFTQRKIADDQIKYERNLLRTLIDNIPDRIFFKDSKGLYLLNNKAHLDAIGVKSQSEITGKSPHGFYPDELADGFIKEELELLRTGKGIYNKEEVRVKRDHTEKLYLLTNKIPVIDSDGRTTGIIGISRDITEWKMHELQLHENEKRWRSAIEGNNQGLWDLNVKTGECFYSPLWKKMLGYEDNEIPNQNDAWKALVHPDDFSYVMKEMDKKLSGETPVYVSEYRLRCKDGSYKWVMAQGNVLSFDSEGNPLRMIGTHTDISKRKNAEEQFSEMNEIFKSFLKHNPLYVYIKNREIRPIYLSDNFEKMIGRPLGEILGKTMDELFPSELSKKMVEDDRRVLREGVYQEFTEELNGLTFNTIKFPIYINGKPKYLAGYTIDITSRNQIEKDLEHQKRFFEQMYLQSATSTQILDKEGWCLRINPKLTEIFGVKPEHIEGKVYNIFNDAEIKRNGIDKILRRVYDEKNTEHWEVHFDIGNAADSQGIEVKDKSSRWYYCTASPIVDNDGNLLYAVIQHEDITERKIAESALLKSEGEYRRLFENANDSIVIFEPESEIVLEANNRALSTYGFSRSEFIGMSIKSISKDVPYGESQVQKLLMNGTYEEFETIHFNKNGTPIYFIINSSVIEYKGQKAILSINRDISERKRAEELIKESEQIFGAAFHNSSALISLSTLEEGLYIDVNETFLKVSGFSREEIIGKSSSELMHFENPKERQKLADAIRRDGQLTDFECRLRMKSGEIRTAIISSVVINIKGKPCLLSTVVDITERKTMEEGLRKFKMSIEHSDEAIFITNEKGEIEYANKSFENIYGFSPSEYLGKTPRILKSGVLPPAVYEHFWSSLITNQSVKGEILNRRKDGKIITIDGSANPIMNDRGELIGFLGIQRDITERKRGEAIQKIVFNVSAAMATTKSIEEFISLIRDQLSAMMDTKNFYVAFYDEETDMLSTPYAQDEMDNISVWSAEKSLTGYLVKSNKSILATREDIMEMIRAGIIDQVGTPSEVWIGVPLRVDEKVIGAIVLQDYNNRDAFDLRSIEILEFVSGQISILLQRKQIEKTLQEKQKILSEAQRIAHIGSWNAILETGKFSWSDEMYRVFDVLPEKFEPSLASILELIHPLDRHKFEESFEKQITGMLEPSLEFRIKASDGSPRYLSFTAGPSFNDNGKLIGAIGAVQDITEQKLAEDQVKKYTEELKEINATKDKFFSIISHDLKNPFHSINGALRLLLDEEEPLSEKDRIKFLKGMLNTSSQAYSLLENLLLWSRNQTGQIDFNPENVNLLELTLTIIGLVKNSSLLKNITITYSVCEDIIVRTDRNMLETVLRNLLTNAIKFTRENGKIEVSAILDGRFAEVSVFDNGLGIEPLNIDRLFKIDQSFSTHGTKSETGSGLGLILCKDFVEKNGGRIRVESEYGKWSKFSFTVPVI